jgi:transketolase
MKEYQVLGNKDTRSGFGDGLLEAGKRNSEVVALCADLIGSVKMDAFAKEFPERMIQCGIAEADMIGIAAGMALSGKVAFASRHSFDSIVVSAFLGLTVVAMYNNYYYLISAISGLMVVFMSSISAGIGNSLVIETKEKNEKPAKRL